MTFIVFKPLAEGGDFKSAKVLDFVEAENYNYKKSWCKIGTFSLTVPKSVEGIENVLPDMLILVLDEYVNDSLIITSVRCDGNHVTLNGRDLKQLLAWRITLFPPSEIEAGTYGYDVSTGSTGSIIRHYISYNLGEEADINRRIHGIKFGNIDAGIAEDTYMSRMQPVNEVVEALCENADIGYSVDIVRDGDEPGYIVTVNAGVDRTNGQTENSKMVFADYTFSADNILVENSTEDRENIIWAINGGTEDTAVVTAVNNSDEESEPSGFLRRETVATVNCEDEDVEIYAKKDSGGKTDKTEIQVQASLYSDYGTRYGVGDKVTVIKNGKAYDMRVLSAEKNCSGIRKQVLIILGNIPAQKVVTRLNYEAAQNKKDSITQRLDYTPGGSGVGEDLGDHNERFNDYENNTVTDTSSYNHVEGRNNTVENTSQSHVSGYGHTVRGSFSCAISGWGNTANGFREGMMTGGSNSFTGTGNLISGQNNQGSGTANIVGGQGNTVGNSTECIVGGYGNTVASSAGSIVGGLRNNVISSNHSIVNGTDNIVLQANKVIAAGEQNTVSGARSGVLGQHNESSGNDSFTCGRYNKNSASYSVMCGEYGTNTANPFAIGGGTSENDRSNLFYVEISSGNVYAKGSYNTIGADYAECFEWADGNPENEDRRGMLVSLKGDRIVPAHGDNILGAVSAHPSVVGNAYEEHWHGKYKTDVFGAFVTDKDGKPILSADYDPNREYIPRSKRPEWAAIGLVGRLIVTDNGKCVPGGYVSARSGKAVPTLTQTKIMCLKRIDSAHIEILVR